MHREFYHKNKTQQWIFEGRLAFKSPHKIGDYEAELGERSESWLESIAGSVSNACKFALRGFTEIWQAPLTVKDLVGSTVKGAIPKTSCAVRQSLGNWWGKMKNVAEVGFSRKLFPALAGAMLSTALLVPNLGVRSAWALPQDIPLSPLGLASGLGEGVVRGTVRQAKVLEELRWDAAMTRANLEKVGSNMLPWEKPSVVNSYSGNETNVKGYVEAIKAA